MSAFTDFKNESASKLNYFSFSLRKIFTYTFKNGRAYIVIKDSREDGQSIDFY